MLACAQTLVTGEERKERNCTKATVCQKGYFLIAVCTFIMFDYMVFFTFGVEYLLPIFSEAANHLVGKILRPNERIIPLEFTLPSQINEIHVYLPDVLLQL